MSEPDKPTFKLGQSASTTSTTPADPAKDPNPVTDKTTTADGTVISTTPASEAPPQSFDLPAENQHIQDNPNAVNNVDAFDFREETPSNPKAFKFGTREVELNGISFKLPGTTIAQDFGEYTDEGFAKPIMAFKHHTVKRFQVGRHNFHNHILQIFNEADLADFLQCYEGLTGPDKTNITQYDWEAAAKMHSPVSDLISRGSMSTKQIKDPKQVA